VADCICLETCNRAELPLRARQDHLRHHRPDHHLPKGPRRGGGRPDHCARRRAAAGAPSNANDTATAPAHPAPIHHHEPVAQLLQGPHQGGLCRVPQQRVPALGPHIAALTRQVREHLYQAGPSHGAPQSLGQLELRCPGCLLPLHRDAASKSVHGYTRGEALRALHPCHRPRVYARVGATVDGAPTCSDCT
jgi:hypothetical protein